MLRKCVFANSKALFYENHSRWQNLIYLVCIESIRAAMLFTYSEVGSVTIRFLERTTVSRRKEKLGQLSTVSTHAPLYPFPKLSRYFGLNFS